MTTDPTDAAAQILEDYEGPSRANTRIAAEVVDAWLHASVACPQCQGTGDSSITNHGTVRCPGPHTQITIHGCPPNCMPVCDPPEILYADPDRIRTLFVGGPPTRDNDDVKTFVTLPLPPRWTPA